MLYAIQISMVSTTVCPLTVSNCHHSKKTAPAKADAVSITMILSDLSDNLDFSKHTLGQCLYSNA